jgi:hypothetical protein
MNGMPDPWYRSRPWRKDMNAINDRVYAKLPVNAEIAAQAFTLTELTVLAELVARGGIVKKSHWVIGCGKQAHSLPPPFTAYVYCKDNPTKPPHVEAFFQRHPRVKQCVACANIDISRRIVLAGFDLIKHRIERPESPWGHR